MRFAAEDRWASATVLEQYDPQVRYGRGRVADLPAETALDMPVQSMARDVEAGAKPKSTPSDIVRRRALLFGFAALLLALAYAIAFKAVSREGISPLEWVGLALIGPPYAVLACWFCSSIAGLGVLIKGGGDPLRINAAAWPARPATRTAILMPVYNEDPEAVLARLWAMDASLAEYGANPQFDIFILSDTTDMAVAKEEYAAFERLRANAASAVYYRRREANVGRKAGNIADWVRRFGGAYEQMLMLDADSLLSGETILRLVSAMERHPSAGLIQTLPLVINGETLFARCLQFGSRLYSRVAWAGLSWWSGAESSYWGHNAIIRVQAFADCCGLPDLKGPRPFGGKVMSHDALESALIRRGGWGVHLAPFMEGSYEEAPPTLPDFAARDRRWAQGNIQHIPLLGAGGLHWMSRLHLSLGIMTYLLSPLWALSLVVGVAARVLMSEKFLTVDLIKHHHIDWSQAGVLLAAIGLTATMLFGPKLMGAAVVLFNAKERTAFGGAGAILGGVLVETLLSALVAPIVMMTQTRALIEIMTGQDSGWKRQRRECDRLPLVEVWAHMGWISFVGLAAYVGLSYYPDLVFWMAPILLGLACASLLIYVTARADWGLKARREGLFLTPEELQAPPIVRKAQAGLPAMPETPPAAPIWTQQVELELRSARVASR